VVRVFCARDGSGGNPLGLFLDGWAIPEEERQGIAAELGYSETVFVDDLERGEMRIFTPGAELPFAGHPVVGTAWLMRERGEAPRVLRPPAGDVGVRFDGELTWCSGHPEWSPPWRFEKAPSPQAIDALPADGDGRVETGVWAWLDEAAGLVRCRVFVNDQGIVEDEATGSAALMLCAELGREIEIRQGEGSVLWARPLDGGGAEVGGRVSPG
jgi:predicted PhzF superfamily epimerase YddE/YHI9